MFYGPCLLIQINDADDDNFGRIETISNDRKNDKALKV